MTKKIPEPKREELVNLYEVERLPSTKIAELYGVSKPVVLRWLRKAKVDMRPQGRGLNTHGKQQPTKEELIKWVYEDKLSYQEIADMFGTTRQAVTYWLDKHHIPHPDTRMARWYRDREEPQLPTVEEFLQLYEQGMSLEHIARDLGISFPVLLGFCKRERIELRPNGWQMGMRYECQDGHIVRSIYEQRVDNWLFDHNILHSVEPLLPFDRRYRSDFLADGWYIEIWGVRKNKKYLERKARKLAQYKEHNLPLIEISEHHFDARRNDPWARILQKFLL